MSIRMAMELAKQLHDRNLSFLTDLLHMTALAEAQHFEQALEVGDALLPGILDYEESAPES